VRQPIDCWRRINAAAALECSEKEQHRVCDGKRWRVAAMVRCRTAGRQLAFVRCAVSLQSAAGREREIFSRRTGQLFVGSVVMICKSFGSFSCLIDRIDGYLLEVVAGCLDEDREERASVARERDGCVVVLCLFTKIRSRSKAT
jgi:hypothetical protein